MANDYDDKSLEDIVAEFNDTPSGDEPKDVEIIDDTSEEKIEGGEPKGEEEIEEVEPNEIWASFDEKFFKSGKLTPFQKEGSEVEGEYDVPKNIDEFEELLEANKTQWLASNRYEQKEEVLADIFKETTPAFQFLAQNANQFTTPEELLPLIQSVQTQEELAQLDITDPEHQEYIVRSVLGLQGFDQEAAEKEIVDLKDLGKLEAWATKYKPTLDKIQADQTEAILLERQQQNQEKNQFLNSFIESLQAEFLQAPDFDGMKLTDEDKVLVASDLFPQDATGAPLYNKIDQLFGEKDIKKLALISMIANLDSTMFESYYASKTHTKAGQSAARKLASGVTSKTTQEDYIPTPTEVSDKTNSAGRYGVFL